jgi:hypothetical protein
VLSCSWLAAPRGSPHHNSLLTQHSSSATLRCAGQGSVLATEALDAWSVGILALEMFSGRPVWNPRTCRKHKVRTVTPTHYFLSYLSRLPCMPLMSSGQVYACVACMKGQQPEMNHWGVIRNECSRKSAVSAGRSSQTETRGVRMCVSTAGVAHSGAPRTTTPLSDNACSLYEWRGALCY